MESVGSPQPIDFTRQCTAIWSLFGQTERSIASPMCWILGGGIAGLRAALEVPPICRYWWSLKMPRENLTVVGRKGASPACWGPTIDSKIMWKIH